jgi:hypothetical protein
MQDFAYLFSDSVGAWLRGRGDGRFKQYEKHYRSDRATAPSLDGFDLESSNVRFSQRYGEGRRPFAPVLRSKCFAALAPFLILLWGGTALVSTAGAKQPVFVAAVLGVIFIARRVKNYRVRT